MIQIRLIFLEDRCIILHKAVDLLKRREQCEFLSERTPVSGGVGEGIIASH